MRHSRATLTTNAEGERPVQIEGAEGAIETTPSLDAFDDISPAKTHPIHVGLPDPGHRAL
jgi:hypothetical protein